MSDKRIVFENIKNEIADVKDFLEDLRKEVETRRLHRAWAGLLEHNTRAVSAMVRLVSGTSMKGWGDLLKAEQRSDPILQFAFQSRDSWAHVHETERKIVPRHVSVAGFFNFGGNSNVVISNSLIVDQSTGRALPINVSFTTENGKLTSASHPLIAEKDHYVLLGPIKNRSGTYAVPNPDTAPERQAVEIGSYVVAWLERKLEELLKSFDESNLT